MSDSIKSYQDLSELAFGLLEPIKDISDAVEEVVGPVKSMMAIHTLRKKMQFKSFLKGYYKKLGLDDSDHAELTERLETHLKDEKNVDTLSRILESALASRSLESTKVLGYVASKHMTEPNKFDFLDEILVNALPQLSDFDLRTAKILVLKHHYYKLPEEDEPYTTEYRIRDIIKRSPELTYEFDAPKFKVSIEKLKREQILDYGGGGIGSVGNARGAFVLSPVLDRLVDYTETMR